MTDQIRTAEGWRPVLRLSKPVSAAQQARQRLIEQFRSVTSRDG